MTPPDSSSTPSPTPQTALHEVLYGNDCFVKMREPQQFEAYMKSQHPSVTMLTCCDSRMHQLVFNFDPIDRTFVIQNIGNQMQAASGSVDYGIRHLKTPLLLVTGHTRCGAIQAAMQNYRHLSFEIIHELNGLHLPLSTCKPTDDAEADWLRAVEANVDYQVELALRQYASEIAAGTLAVAGCVYDFANLYGYGHGRLLLANLNGETSREALLASPLVSSLEAELRDSSICPRNHPRA